MIRVVKKITVLDNFHAKYKVAQIEHSGLPEWVSLLVTEVPESLIRMALDRYAEPLIREFRYTPDQCLDRIPERDRVCAVKKGCFGWVPHKCTNLKRNTCELLLMPGATETESSELTTIVNLWREKYNVVTAKTES
jgi:hypothetical protein